ncbi:MAG TPA: GTPase domain-containing protein [Thermoanaerobaculia bacterium]|nr:GTPase domain-containing protein [Thermoanaerobaculia bacterium]
MALLNKAINEITIKLVYYGPGLCGKTTNLEKIHADGKLQNKGKLLSMSTETDRTLFFDFMPLELGTVGGQKVRVQLYTVPGQVFYNATRKLVLRGADGVVFVADSQPTMRSTNTESLANLRENLRINRLDPEKVPLVFQYNKRDLPDVDSVETMSGYLSPGKAPVIEAAAIQGKGVRETLQKAISLILQNLRNNVDVSLKEEEVVAEAAAEPAPAPAPSPAPPPAPASDPLDAPFAAAEPPPVAAPAPAPAKAAEPLNAPFGDEPLGSADGGEPLLERAREVVRSLEVALEAAREHERKLSEHFGRR